MAVEYSREELQEFSKEVMKENALPGLADLFSNIHTFEGVMFTGWVPRESLLAIRELEMKEDDILIATFPKSGTHWMWETTLLILARGHPEKIDRMKMVGTGLELLFPPELKTPSHEIFAKMESPRIMATHLPWQFLPTQATLGKKGRIIYVMRNPKDTLASMSRFMNATNHGMEKDEKSWKYYLNTFLTGQISYGSWFDHVHTYWKNRDQENVFFTSYEELKQDFLSVARPLSQFLLGDELEIDALKRVEEHATVKGMKKSYDDIEKQRKDGEMITKLMGTHSFIQKGVIGSWKELFTVADNELFDKVAEEKMSNWEIRPVYEG